MEFYKFNTKAETIQFCILVNRGENITVSDYRVTTGYCQPIEFRDRFYIVKDAVTSKYTTQTPISFEGRRLNTTPPTSNGKGLVIITRFQWVFPLKLNGFTVEMKDQNGTKYIEKSVLTWQNFLDEINADYNDDFKLMLDPLIQYLKTTATEIDV